MLAGDWQRIWVVSFDLQNKKEVLSDSDFWSFFSEGVNGPQFPFSLSEFAQKKVGTQHGRPDVADMIPVQLVLLISAAPFLDPGALDGFLYCRAFLRICPMFSWSPVTPSLGGATSYSPEGGYHERPNSCCLTSVYMELNWWESRLPPSSWPRSGGHWAH